MTSQLLRLGRYLGIFSPECPVEPIAKSMRYPLKFRVGTLTVGITEHARYRGVQRRINWEDKLRLLIGETFDDGQDVDEYKDQGIISKYYGQQHLLRIITVYNCK